MTDATVFHEAVWGFQVQQTIEKALKTWLYLSGVEPPFTHDLVVLLKLLEQAGCDITPYRDLARFTDFAVQVRYDDQPDLLNLDRSNWNGRAEALVSVIEAIDLLLYPRSKVEERRHWLSHVIALAHREGRVLDGGQSR